MNDSGGGDPRILLRRLISLIVVVAFILTLALVVEKEGQRELPASLESLTENFTAMVFEESGEPGRLGRLIRWRQPVRVALTGQEPEAWLGQVTALLAEFETLTGVPFSIARPPRTNLTIVFSRQEFERSALLTARPDNVQCVATTAAGRAGSITGARVTVSRRRRRMRWSARSSPETLPVAINCPGPI